MDADRLKPIPLFASLSRRHRRQLAGLADEVEVAEGTWLVKEGDFAYEFFVIEEGTARVTREGEELATLARGDFFGEIALLGAERRTASVLAETPMRLIVMFGREFRSMADEYPDIADKVKASMRERLGGD